MTDLRFRNAELVVAVLGYVTDADGPVPWNELVGVFTDDARPWKTVENTIYDLVKFGALHRIGKPGDRRRQDTRALLLTDLARAWLDRVLLPLPTDDRQLVDAGDPLVDAVKAEFADVIIDLDAVETHLEPDA